MSLSSRRKTSGKKQTLENNIKDLITAAIILGIMSSIGPRIISQLEPRSRPISKWSFIIIFFILMVVVIAILVYVL